MVQSSGNSFQVGGIAVEGVLMMLKSLVCMLTTGLMNTVDTEDPV